MKASHLAGQTCTPCRGGIPPLGSEEARELLAVTPGWELTENDTQIRRRIRFETFPGAIEFVGRVAELAEQQGHHPDFGIHYRDVDLILYTHAIGGLHENDFIMAAKINELADG
jgi:4a-hydroxytetrahydrobiopterin dehydratase